MRPTPPPHVITRLLLSLGRAHSLRRPLHSRPLHAPLAASLRPFHSLRRANHHHRLPVVVGVVVNCCKVVVVYEVFICCWRTPPSSSHIVVAHRRWCYFSSVSHLRSSPEGVAARPFPTLRAHSHVVEAVLEHHSASTSSDRHPLVQLLHVGRRLRARDVASGTRGGVRG